MNLTNETSADNKVLQLAGALDIYAAESLREVLLTRFGDTAEIMVGLGKIETCDTAGIQLLLAARRKAAEGARTLHFCNVPAAVRICGKCLGLPEDL